MFLDIFANVSSTHEMGPTVNSTTTICECHQRYHPDSVMRNFSDTAHPDLPPMSTLEMIASAYTSAHGVLSLVVCAFGIPMNVLNITVLTRKHMRTPVNCILTWLAVFDLLTMVSYVPFSLHFYCLTEPWLSPERNSLGWMTFLVFHVDFTATTHTISIWLGVTLAMFRYKHIFSPAKGHLTRVRRLIRARIAVFIVVIVSILVMIPNYLMNRLMPLGYTDPATNLTNIVFVNEPLNLGTPDVKPLAQVNLWLHSALAKFLPCILMVVYGGLLVKTLRTNIRMIARHTGSRPSDSFIPPSPQHEHAPLRQQTSDSTEVHHENERQDSRSHNGDALCANCKNQRQTNSTNSNHTTTTTIYLSTPSTSPPNVPKKRPSTTPLTGGTSKAPARHQDNSRTTRMLLVVITLFLVTELPQGILIMLSATIPGFFQDVYIPLGDMMDVIALVNNGINFLLYCIMSRDFRTCLLDMFKSTMNKASEMPSRVTTTFYKPSAAVFDQNEQSHATLIVRANDFST